MWFDHDNINDYPYLICITELLILSFISFELFCVGQIMATLWVSILNHFLASFIPCMSWVYQCSNARKVGQPGLIASQGCLCVYCCFPFAMFMWAIKTRYYVKLRLGIQVSLKSHISRIASHIFRMAVMNALKCTAVGHALSDKLKL